MKQGTKFLLPISIDFDLSLVEKIEFIFRQDKRQNTKKFEFPSSTAVIDDEDETLIDLIWTKEDTYIFSPELPLMMDTRIKLIDSDYNPETEIVKLTLNPTLFRQGD